MSATAHIDTDDLRRRLTTGQPGWLDCDEGGRYADLRVLYVPPSCLGARTAVRPEVIAARLADIPLHAREHLRFLAGQFGQTEGQVAAMTFHKLMPDNPSHPDARRWKAGLLACLPDDKIDLTFTVPREDGPPVTVTFAAAELDLLTINRRSLPPLRVSEARRLPVAQ